MQSGCLHSWWEWTIFRVNDDYSKLWKYVHVHVYVSVFVISMSKHTGTYIKINSAYGPVLYTTEVFDEYTTPDPYLLINNLEPAVTYTCRVAAYTVSGSGPFSELMMITLNSGSTYVSVSVIVMSKHTGT